MSNIFFKTPSASNPSSHTRTVSTDHNYPKSFIKLVAGTAMIFTLGKQNEDFTTGKRNISSRGRWGFRFCGFRQLLVVFFFFFAFKNRGFSVFVYCVRFAGFLQFSLWVSVFVNNGRGFSVFSAWFLLPFFSGFAKEVTPRSRAKTVICSRYLGRNGCPADCEKLKITWKQKTISQISRGWDKN